MNKYSVIEISDMNSDFLIIANTYENPINTFITDGYISFINTGNVIFDLAIINGMSLNRFVRISVKNHRLILDTIEILSDISKEILNCSKQYFVLNKDIVMKSVLPSAVKYLLTN